MYLRKGNFEALLNLFQNLLVLVIAHERDGKTLGTETAGTTDSVKVGAGIAGQIIVDSQVDSLNINTTTEDVSGNADSFLELLELLVAANSDNIVSNPMSSQDRYGLEAYRSSWLTPEWTAIDGKLHSRSSLSSSVARMVLLTKIMTWLN